MTKLHAISALTHSEPYAWYAQLAQSRPFAFDSTLRVWVAASAEAVTATLRSDLCRVRPEDEPVPTALLGSVAGEMFSALARMNDGETHACLKSAIVAALASVDLRQLRAISVERARELWPGTGYSQQCVLGFAFALPIQTLGSLLGVPRVSLPRLVELASDFAGCLAPGADAERIERGRATAGELRDVFRDLLLAGPSGLLERLAHEMGQAGCGDREVVAANAAGFMFQAHDAMAGLIGNTIVALIGSPALMAAARHDPGTMRQVVLEVLERDPSIHNTRRFVVRDGELLGQRVRAGDVIQVALAAANRDPARPLDLWRPTLGGFGLGAGQHACPGGELAAAIAEAGVGWLLESGALDGSLARPVTYLPSANTRIPALAFEPGDS